MSLFNDFLKYRDSYGLNQLNSVGGEGQATQNGALFTMQYLICLEENNDENLQNEIERLRWVFKSLEEEFGLSRRFPDSTEIDSMDNQAALLTFSALYDKGRYARNMIDHGKEVKCEGIDPYDKVDLSKKTYWVARILNFGFQPKNFWNCRKPNLFHIDAWWGRSPSLLGLSKMAASECVNPFLWLGVLVGQFVGAFNKVEDTDARTLPFITWHFLKQRSKFWSLAYKLWLKLLYRKYPNGMKDVYWRYYLDKSHPIIKYSGKEI